MAIAGCAGANPELSAPRPVPVAPFKFGNPDVVLLVTGGTNARIEKCACDRTFPGGLARRSGLVQSYRAAFPHTILLDTGDLFWVDPKDTVSDWAIRGYRLIGYDALVLGDQEWSVGPRLHSMLGNRMLSYPGRRDIVFLNAGIQVDYPDCATLPVQGSLRRQWGSAKLAIVSYLAEDASIYMPTEVINTLKFPSPKAIHEQIAALKKEGHVVVLAAHAEEATVVELARTSGADLVLRGHTERSDEAVCNVGEVPVLKIGGPETVGVIALKLKAGRIVDLEYRLEEVDTRWPIDARLVKLFDEYLRQMDQKK